MQTSALITLLANEFPDWSRVKLLMYLNEIQQIIFTRSTTNQMRLYDSSTGLDPVLTTVSPTREYLINTTNGFTNNVWRVGAVYNTDITEPLDVNKFDGYPGYAAKIVFKEDPGSGQYFIRCFRYPSTLSVESIQLEVPAGFHITHVYEGMCGIIERTRSGKSERWEKFEKILLPDIIMKMNETNSIFNVPYKGY